MDLRGIQILILFINIDHVYNERSVAPNDNSDFNSDTYLNSTELIAKNNYVPETHAVITDDGYKVTLFRIPNRGPPVLLAHGVGDSSDSWLVLGKPDSLAYQLADTGFDVWLFNQRGNRYSDGHVRKEKLTSKQYWNFSYEEIGIYDLPATIDHILSVTKYEKMSYVGFSQGTTVFIVMCTMRPEYNNKIKNAVLLAPVARVSKIKFPLINYLSQNIEEIVYWTKKLNIHGVFTFNNVTNNYHVVACNISSPFKVLCDIEYYVFFGLLNSRHIRPEKFPVLTSHVPAGISVKNLVHYVQSYGKKSFQRFDYGPRRNKILYGSQKPPEYDVSLVTAPVSLYSSEVDWLSTKEDLKFLTRTLPNIQRSVTFNKTLDFTHLEFVYGARVKNLINDPVVRLLST